MTKVTFNGKDYSDLKSESPRYMEDGGHRTHLFPMLQDMVVEVSGAVSNAASNAAAAAQSETNAAHSETNAASSEASALQAASDAQSHAAGLNLPGISASDAGKALLVNDAGTGYEVGSPVLYASAEGVLGQGDALSIPTPNVSVNRRFDRRLVQVLEETVGTTATDQTLDMDFSGEAQWDYEATPGAVDLTLTQDADTTLSASPEYARVNRGNNNYQPASMAWIAKDLFLYTGNTYDGGGYRPYLQFVRVAHTSEAWPDDSPDEPVVHMQRDGYFAGLSAYGSICRLDEGKSLFLSGNGTGFRAIVYQHALGGVSANWESKHVADFSGTFSSLAGMAPIDSNRVIVAGIVDDAFGFHLVDVTDIAQGTVVATAIGSYDPSMTSVDGAQALIRLAPGKYALTFQGDRGAGQGMHFLPFTLQNDTITFLTLFTAEEGASYQYWNDQQVGASPCVDTVGLVFTRSDGSRRVVFYKISIDWPLQAVNGELYTAYGGYRSMYRGGFSGLVEPLPTGQVPFIGMIEGQARNVYCWLTTIDDGGTFNINGQLAYYGHTDRYAEVGAVAPELGLFCTFFGWSSFDYMYIHRLSSAGPINPLFRLIYGQNHYDAVAGQPFAPADIGLSIFGGDGLARISSLKQLATGGTAFASAGTAANAFDGDTAMSCDAGLNGHIGYDFGAQKTINALGLTAPSSVTWSLVVEVSDDNFSSDIREVDSFSVDLTANTTSWLTVASPASGQYLRIRVTDNASLSLSHVVLSDGSGAVSGKAFTQPAPGTLAAGEWDVSALRFAGGQVEAVAANQPLVTRDNTMDTSMWESITGGTFNGAGGCEATLFDGPQQSNNADWYVVPLTAASGVLVYENSGLYAVAFTLDVDGVPTLGSPLRMGNNTSYGPYSVAAVSDDTFVVLYLSSANSSYPHVQAATVSGTSITLGNPVQVASYSTERGSIFKLAEGKFGVVCATGPSTIAARAGTVSGQTITLGSSVNAYSTTPTSGYCTGARLDADKGIAIYPTSSGIRARVFTANGTTLSVSGEFVVSSDYTTGVSYPAAAALDTDKVLLTFSNSGIKALPFTVSGTTLGEAGAALAVIPNNSNHTHPMVLGANHVVVQYSDEKLRQLRVDGVAVTEELTGDVAFTAGTANGNCAGAAMAGYFWMLERNTSPANTTKLVRYELGASGLLAAPYFAISFDDRRTFRVWGGAAAVDIASDKNAVHGGTDGVWHYKAADGTWTPASQDALLTALKEGFGATPAHRTGKQVYSNMTSAEWQTLGWIKSATGKIDVALLLNNGDSADVLAFDYTSRSTWTPVSGADYRIDLELESEVRVTRTASGAASVKAVVQYQPGS